MTEFINSLASESLGTSGVTTVLLLALVLVFTLLDRRVAVVGLGVVYGCVFLLMRGVTVGSIVFLELVTGFFVSAILGMTLWQTDVATVTLESYRADNSGLAVSLRLVTVLIALVLVWLVARLVGSLPPLPAGRVVPVFALCGLGLWLAIIGRNILRTSIGLLLFLNGLLLFTGVAQSPPSWLGILATLQLLVAVVAAFLLNREPFASVPAS